MNTKKEEGENGFTFLFKIIMVGDAGVGKTNILSRYIYGKLPRYEHPTIGVEFTSKPV